MPRPTVSHASTALARMFGSQPWLRSTPAGILRAAIDQQRTTPADLALRLDPLHQTDFRAYDAEST
jgi:hypothetical protein